MKKHKSDKFYCVRFIFEEKHIPISEGINKDLENYLFGKKLFKENLSIINYRKLSPNEQYKQHYGYPKSKQNQFFAYFHSHVPEWNSCE